MSSLLVCAQPATGFPDVFVPKDSPSLLLKKLAAVPRLTPVTPASRLEARPEPEMVSSGVEALDLLTGGLPRGCLSEMCGPASSGRTSVLLASLAAATRRHEACALVDVSDAFDPQSAATAGMEFRHLLWIRCDPGKEHLPQRHPSTSLRAGFDPENTKRKQFDSIDQALKATDLLLQSGGFGLVAIDLGDVPVQAARRIPLTSWFRFRRAVENTPTVLLVIARGSCARTCASLVLELRAAGVGQRASGKSSVISSEPEKSETTHGKILAGLEVQAELSRSRLERKPVQSVTLFRTQAGWAGAVGKQA